jgi:hypothetical protein
VGPIPAMLLLLSIPAAAQDPCTILAAKRSAEVGCHFTAAESIGTVLPDRVFRQLYTYPTRSAAESADGSQYCRTGNASRGAAGPSRCRSAVEHCGPGMGTARRRSALAGSERRAS